MKKIFTEFKTFAMKGNVLDLAIGVIMGGAFGKIVTSFVNDVLMPLLSLLIGKVNFASLKIVLEEAVGDTPEVAILYGQFFQNIIDFLIIAFSIFMVVRVLTKMKKKEEAAPKPAAPSKEEVLLAEIRDILKEKK